MEQAQQELEALEKMAVEKEAASQAGASAGTTTSQATPEAKAQQSENEKQGEEGKDSSGLKIPGLGKSTILKDRYVINLGKPIAELDMPTAKAFEVEDKRSHGRTLFALVCDPQVPPRTALCAAFRGFNHKGLLPFVDSGDVEWPMTKSHVFALIYERPLGGRVMVSMTSKIKPVEDTDLINIYCKPLVSALAEMQSRGITHRAIRPTNMYYMDVEKTRMVFGDCLSVPPGYEQPAFCEPIEMMMSMPQGRGSGSYADDRYSFGATVLLMVLGYNPLKNMGVLSMLEAKIAKGSYATLVGETRVSLAMVEMLRGLLADNLVQRWDIESVEMWLGGRRLSPIQSRGPKVSQRAFMFCGKEYFTARDIAMAMARNWERAVEPIRDGKLEVWLKRGLDDEKMSRMMPAIVDDATIRVANKRAQNDIIVANVAMILDPAAPLRYKRLSLMADGLGTALFHAIIKGADTKMYAELIQRDLIQDWYKAQERFTANNKYATMRAHLQRTKMGFGIERVLYEIDEHLPCLSPLVKAEYVDSVQRIIPALDAAAKKINTKVWPLDRHLVAYVASHMGNKVDDQVEAINNSDPAVATAGMVSLLAVLQWRFGPEKAYALASWVGGLVGPVIKSYHNRSRRKLMEKEIPKLVRQGRLPDLYSYLDNAEERSDDTRGFTKAKGDFMSSKKAIRELETGRVEREKESTVLGQQIAAMTSIFIGIMTMFIMALARVF